MLDISHSEEILTISRLNRDIRFLIEGTFPFIWVEGEVSNFIQAHSGHWYFSLKDEAAQVRCAMFRPQNRRLILNLKDGMQVLVKARPSLYEGRGEFQLIIETLEEAGIGKLQKAFELLKKKLGEKGLFDAVYKKSLPSIPRCIGIVTSPTGAAIRDILHVLKRRYAVAPVIIYPTLVQGEKAAANIIKALKLANQRQECDVLILARGGGCLEDLWPFNEESVAQAIFDSSIPIITGIGHEIDFTIADFTADVRAPTPSAAAELITPDSTELTARFLQSKQRLLFLIKQKLQYTFEQLQWIEKNLTQWHPKNRLLEKLQQLDFCTLKITRLQQILMHQQQQKLHELSQKLFDLTPVHRIHQQQMQLKLCQATFNHLMKTLLQKKQQAFHQQVATLDALSPLATLKRGFAIVTVKKNHALLRSVSQIKTQDKIDVQVTDGKIECIVT